MDAVHKLGERGRVKYQGGWGGGGEAESSHPNNSPPSPPRREQEEDRGQGAGSCVEKQCRQT